MCYGTFRIARILALYTTAEITIRLGVVKDREEVQKLPAEAIVQKVQQIHPACTEVIVARNLSSGDVRLYLTRENARHTILYAPE